jgi:prolyl 4-hydroxylase
MQTNPGPAPQESAIASMRTSMLDYVMLGKSVLSPEHCQRLIERFEASEAIRVCRFPGGHSFTQLEITTAWPEENDLLLPVFLDHFERYQKLTRASYWPANIAFEHLRIKRYLPNEQNFFAPHVDVVDQLGARRFITAFVYLNEPEGGETVFPNLDLAILPETGKLLVFPPLWLFPHEGRPPRLTAKYILHTYLRYGS